MANSTPNQKTLRLSQSAATEPLWLTCRRKEKPAMDCTYLLAMWSGAPNRAWSNITNCLRRSTIMTATFVPLQKNCYAELIKAYVLTQILRLGEKQRPGCHWRIVVGMVDQ